jgi:two-component system response regulator
MRAEPILLVEDSADDVMLTMRAFAKNGMRNEVVVAGTGRRALDLLLPADGAEALQPALVLLDLKLPEVGGLDVLKRLRADERTRRIPVVVLTSSNEPTDLDEAYSRGANSYVRKPVAFADFLEVLKQLGLYWLVLNEPPPERVG